MACARKHEQGSTRHALDFDLSPAPGPDVRRPALISASGVAAVSSGFQPLRVLRSPLCLRPSLKAAASFREAESYDRLYGRQRPARVRITLRSSTGEVKRNQRAPRITMCKERRGSDARRPTQESTPGAVALFSFEPSRALWPSLPWRSCLKESPGPGEAERFDQLRGRSDQPAH